jgi:hypothetical protein
MVLFLDFDGVLHPLLARHGGDAFCYLPRLENVLRDFPAVRLVVASARREGVSLSDLAQHFAPDIACRIVGATPVLLVVNACDISSNRYREIQAYLNGSGERWFALDDDASLYPPECGELIVCDDGFRDAEEKALRRALATAD